MPRSLLWTCTRCDVTATVPILPLGQQQRLPEGWQRISSPEGIAADGELQPGIEFCSNCTRDFHRFLDGARVA